ncbi:hypothetical protein [Micromonospora sp. LOL_023]|uniref:hypothetical protein n=1 Tax=Micromonospora sp. LOL_023 TaxID=3345418 RepID=UPI003A86DA9D
MTRRLWWRVEEILPLAEHAAATPRQRKTRDEVERMADHLHGLSIGDMPGEHPVLRLGAGFVSVQWEADTGEDSSRWIEEDRVPADADDHYAVGAYQWRWTPATMVEEQP